MFFPNAHTIYAYTTLLHIYALLNAGHLVTAHLASHALTQAERLRAALASHARTLTHPFNCYYLMALSVYKVVVCGR